MKQKYILCDRSYADIHFRNLEIESFKSCINQWSAAEKNVLIPACNNHAPVYNATHTYW